MCETKLKKGNRGGFGEIHVTREFFKDSGLQGHFSKKKNCILIFSYGACTKFYVSFLFRFERGCDTAQHTPTHRGSLGSFPPLGDNWIFDITHIYTPRLKMLKFIFNIFIHFTASVSECIAGFK